MGVQNTDANNEEFSPSLCINCQVLYAMFVIKHASESHAKWLGLVKKRSRMPKKCCQKKT